MKVSLMLCIIVSFGLQHADCVDQIPNEFNVPNPCKTFTIWEAVKYQNPAGGGAKNPFGLDFDRYGGAWNTEICQADSDGDGRTNGQELNDPDCVWTPDSGELRPPIGHPGVCEPVWTQACRNVNQWMRQYCKPDTHCMRQNQDGTCQNCFGLEPTPLTALKSATAEPYRTCQRFGLLPSSQLIGMKPLWRSQSTKQVVKEIIIYGCYGQAVNLEQQTLPYDAHIRCNAEPPSSCSTILFRWKPEWGDEGYCLSGSFGFKMNPATGFKYALVQSLIVPKTDVDVLVAHDVSLYQSGDRPQNAATVTVGPYHVVLPARQRAVNASGSCSQDCTSTLFTSNFNVAAVDIRMSSLGRQVYIERWKNGRFVSKILHEPSFTNQQLTLRMLPEPVTVQRGEEIRISCTYDSSAKLNTVYREDAQCEATLIYFPQQVDILTNRRASCRSYNRIDSCDVQQNRRTNVCNLDAFYSSPRAMQLFSDVQRYCFKSNDNTANPSDKLPYCNGNCKGILQSAYANIECLKGDRKYAFMEYLMARQYQTKLEADTKLRFDQEVYEGMAVCHGAVPGDELTSVDPNKITPAPGTKTANSGAVRVPTAFCFLALSFVTLHVLL